MERQKRLNLLLRDDIQSYKGVKTIGTQTETKLLYKEISVWRHEPTIE